MIMFTRSEFSLVCHLSSILRDCKFLGDSMIRLGIPSKGRMEAETSEFLSKCGLTLSRVRRRYLASIDELPEMQVVYQRQEDIIKGVETGFLTFGIAGKDLVSEYVNSDGVVTIHENLGFGKCTLEIAVPESWEVDQIQDLRTYKGRLRVASKFPKLTTQFLEGNGISFEFVPSAGTLEVSPALNRADFIVDLVSTGQTLEDNRLKRINGGRILESEAVFIGNKNILKKSKDAMKTAKRLLEIFEGALRAKDYVSVFANMRGDAKKIVPKLFQSPELSGLQGPTVSSVINRDNGTWFAIHIIVPKKQLMRAISNLREVGGSGVVVSQAMYIFEEEPPQYRTLLKKLGVMK